VSGLLPIVGAGLLILTGAAVAWWLGRGRHRAPSEGRPPWLGLDVVRVEADVRARMDELRWEKRMPPLKSDPSLDELARRHASTAASDRRAAGEPGEGLSLERHRRMLYPELLGPVDHADAEADGLGGDVERSVSSIADQLTAQGIWFDPRWTAGAIGAAADHGRISVCAVVARRLAVLDDVEWPDADDGLPWVQAPRLILGGVLAEGLATEAGLQLLRPTGDVEKVRAEVRGRRFSLVVMAEGEGSHSLYADDDLLFCWRFGNPEKQ